MPPGLIIESLKPLYSTTQPIGITSHISSKYSPMLNKINVDNNECNSCYKSFTNPYGECICDHSKGKYMDPFPYPSNVVPYYYLGEIYFMENQLTAHSHPCFKAYILPGTSY